MDTTATLRSVEAARGRREELRQATSALENAVARPLAADDWLDVVSSVFLALDGAFQAHCDEVESPDGLFTDVLARAPRLASKVEELRAEHTDIARLLADAGRPGTYDYEDLVDLRHKLVGLIGAIGAHRRAGADLVYEAFNVDIGGGL